MHDVHPCGEVPDWDFGAAVSAISWANSSQKSKCFTRGVFANDFSHFLQVESFIAKVASFQLKNITFIILILNKLKVFCSWFVCFNFVTLRANNIKDEREYSTLRQLHSRHHLWHQRCQSYAGLWFGVNVWVDVSQLKRQVRRNIDRFPEDFMFELTAEEVSALRCQNGILKTGRGQHSKYFPYQPIAVAIQQRGCSANWGDQRCTGPAAREERGTGQPDRIQGVTGVL